ncbi:MAG: lactate utilization protein C, partial [Burkholderiales bacterium]
MSARERILSRIRERQGKSAAADSHEIEAVRAHIGAHERNPVPGDTWEPLKRFRERALSLASSVDCVATVAEAPARVAAYLSERKLASRAVCWRELAPRDWFANGVA